MVEGRTEDSWPAERRGHRVGHAVVCVGSRPWLPFPTRRMNVASLASLSSPCSVSHLFTSPCRRRRHSRYLTCRDYLELMAELDPDLIERASSQRDERLIEGGGFLLALDGDQGGHHV